MGDLNRSPLLLKTLLFFQFFSYRAGYTKTGHYSTGSDHLDCVDSKVALHS